MEKFSTLVPVAAAALIDGCGRILLQRRRYGAVHGGLWEFPGGKIEAGESPESALIREIREELGVSLDLAAMEPLAFASDPVLPPARREPFVILLYSCRSWQGEPRCLGGEAIGWFAPHEIPGLPMPQLDVPLARSLLRLR